MQASGERERLGSRVAGGGGKVMVGSRVLHGGVRRGKWWEGDVGDNG